MDEVKLLQRFTKGVDEDIDLQKPPIDMAGDLVYAKNDFQVSPSSYIESEQEVFDNALYNNLDIVSNNKLFERLKDYEQEYGDSSDDFYEKWMNGEIASNPDIQEWMMIYKNILMNNNLCQAE
jgi:hypothetical protein